MLLNHVKLLSLLSFLFVTAHLQFAKGIDLTSNQSFIQVKPAANLQNEIVKIQVYYESLCPGCRYEISTTLKSTMKKLGDLIDVNIYPYGGTSIVNGKPRCQHGPLECYGNMLHACALNKISNKNEAIVFNGCMMDDARSGDGSDDKAADECGSALQIDPVPIKECAKSSLGLKLLEYYGKLSNKVHYKYVPWTLINGKKFDIMDDFFQAVCAAFKIRPKACIN